MILTSKIVVPVYIPPLDVERQLIEEWNSAGGNDLFLTSDKTRRLSQVLDSMRIRLAACSNAMRFAPEHVQASGWLHIQRILSRIRDYDDKIGAAVTPITEATVSGAAQTAAQTASDVAAAAGRLMDRILTDVERAGSKVLDIVPKISEQFAETQETVWSVGVVAAVLAASLLVMYYVPRGAR